MMSFHRVVQFTDSWNTRWVVYEEVVAASASTRPFCRLLFMTDMVARRTLRAPACWWAASLRTLEAMCNDASPCDWTPEAESVLACLHRSVDLTHRTFTPPAVA